MADCHHLLRGGKLNRRFEHGLSKREMQSLRSLCETFFPPITNLPNKQDDIVRSFFELSGSHDYIPEEVGESLVKKFLLRAILLVRFLLLLLSTKLGTLLVCGSLCFKKTWPYVHCFPELALEKREKVIQMYFKTKWLPLLRVAFLQLKVICLFIIFTRVDENGDNVALKAIGYEKRHVESQREAPRRRPLANGVIETCNETERTLCRSLSEKGLQVTEERDVYRIKCDAVVIGSGAGGGVAAAVLSSAGYKVVVVEKGNYFAPEDFSSLEGPSYEELYEASGVLGTMDFGVITFAGSAVGGGTLINWSACVDTPDDVIEEWSEEKKLSMFGTAEFRSAIEHVKERLGVTKGCIKEGFQNQVLRKGCKNRGLEVNYVPRNSDEDHYCGSCMFGCPTGDKRGSDRTWLVDSVEHGGVILTGCKANKLILEENVKQGRRKLKCSGVIVMIKKKKILKKLHIEAKVTVSSCGALLTPPLLISSGLRNRHIGSNLHLHPALMAWGYFPETDISLTGKAYEGGIITSVHKMFNRDSTVAAMIETSALGPGAFAIMWPWKSGLDMKLSMMKYGRIANLAVLVRDKGCGKVKKERKITYKFAKEDEEKMKLGLHQALRILVGAGAVEVGTHRSDGKRLSCKGVSEEEIEEFVRLASPSKCPLAMVENWSIYGTGHQMGSCRMGISEKEGAVDMNGESWEAEGLFVCDGSVLPTALGVNPMITIQATAHCITNRAVDHLNKEKKAF